MSTPKEAIETGLTAYQALVGEVPQLEDEFDSSQRAFFAAGTADRADRSLADRRHLEWFLLERPSDHLGGVPAEALLSAWIESVDTTIADHSSAFLQSLAGAFEVTSTEPGRGVWIRDLFGLGEYPVQEPEAAFELAAGDLLVGRLFPIGEGLFQLSPAVSCFRNRDLVSAVRDDLERMRAGRRGVLRIQQIELERLFFYASAPVPRAPALEDAPGVDAPPIDIEQERRRALQELTEAGLERELAQEAIDTIGMAARDGRSVVTEILNELAFHSEADLQQAQRALAELWAVETHADEKPTTALGRITESSASQSQPEAESSEDKEVARQALEAFDRGRAEGADLDALFQQLAEDLGVEAPPTEDAELSADALPQAPVAEGIPGILAPLVEEFLWDVGRERGGAHEERLAGLRRLSDYGEEIHDLDDLNRRVLLDFAGRWLLDEGSVDGPEEARAVLDALAEFCRWLEERHDHPVWTSTEDLLDSLRTAVPRLVAARQRSAQPGPHDEPWDVAAVDDPDLVLLAHDGREKRLRSEAGLAEFLRAGDLVHARVENSNLRISACYPAELRELLQRDA